MSDNKVYTPEEFMRDVVEPSGTHDMVGKWRLRTKFYKASKVKGITQIMEIYIPSINFCIPDYMYDTDLIGKEVIIEGYYLFDGDHNISVVSVDKTESYRLNVNDIVEYKTINNCVIIQEDKLSDSLRIQEAVLVRLVLDNNVSDIEMKMMRNTSLHITWKEQIELEK